MQTYLISRAKGKTSGYSSQGHENVALSQFDDSVLLGDGELFRGLRNTSLRIKARSLTVGILLGYCLLFFGLLTSLLLLYFN